MELMYESEKQVVMHHFAAEISIYKVTALRCLLFDYKVKNHKKSGAVALNSAAVLFSCTFFEVALMRFLMKPLETTAFIKK